MNVTGILAYDGSERELDLDQWLEDGWQDAILDAYLDGVDVDELGELLFDYLDPGMPPFYHQMFDPGVDEKWHLDITDMEWGDE